MVIVNYSHLDLQITCLLDSVEILAAIGCQNVVCAKYFMNLVLIKRATGNIGWGWHAYKVLGLALNQNRCLV